MLDAGVIRTLAEGESIAEPGFYAIDIERHHGQPCDGPSVTSGILRKMELESPADVWAFHQLNPNRWPRPETDALRLGRAMAAFIEAGIEGLKECFLILPENKPSRPTAAQRKAFDEGRASDKALDSIQFWDAIEADGRSILSAKELETLTDMGRVLAQDPAARAALGGMPEITMAWMDEATGLWCLARPDQIEFSGMLSDYKKVAAAGSPFSARLCNRRAHQHGYHMQMAFAAEGFQILTGEWASSVGLIFQSGTPPHHVIAMPIEDEALRIGMFQNDRARRRFRECLDAGHWPGPGEEVTSFRLPEWDRDRLIEEMGASGVPL